MTHNTCNQAFSHVHQPTIAILENFAKMSESKEKVIILTGASRGKWP